MSNTKYFFALFLIYNLIGCTKSDNNTNTVNSSTISISPTHGPGSTIDTLRGTGFSVNANSNSVYFNGVSANVISATSTELIVKVPKLAGTGPVTVVTNGTTSAGPLFTYDTTWAITTIAGNGTKGSADGLAASSSFNNPKGIAVDTAGNIFVADSDNHTVRKITSSGIVSTLAGQVGQTGYTDGVGSSAVITEPLDLSLDANGNLYVVGIYFGIRKITPTGLVTTYAGNPNIYGSSDGPANTATFKSLSGVCLDKQGNVFVADASGENIRKITPDGMVSTFAGSGITGRDNGPKNTATFFQPSDVVVTDEGIVYTSEIYNPVIRKIGSDNIVTTLAGSTNGYAEGIGIGAKFHGNVRLVVDQAGNIYVTDFENYMIRKITPSGETTRLVLANNVDSAIQVPLTFGRPYGLAIDKKGNLYFTDISTNSIRKLSYQ